MSRAARSLRLTLALLALAVASSAVAQVAWPAKPLRIIAPTVPSSFSDLAARIIAAELAEQMGQPVVVDLRPGGGTTIGTGAVARSPADGYTLLMTENTFTTTPATYPKLDYDPLKDFFHLTLVAEAPTIFWARPDLPAATLKDLVALAHAQPGRLSFGSGGQGTTSHLAAELLFDATKMKVIHVPFKGVGASMTEVAAGRVDFGGSSIATPIPLIKAGRLRPLAVTGQARNPLLPEVPTFAEAGFPGYDAPIWWGLVLPAGVPEDVWRRLHAEVAKALGKPKLQEFFASRGAPVRTSTPAEFTRVVAREIQGWKSLVARAGLKFE